MKIEPVPMKMRGDKESYDVYNILLTQDDIQYLNECGISTNRQRKSSFIKSLQRAINTDMYDNIKLGEYLKILNECPSECIVTSKYTSEFVVVTESINITYDWNYQTEIIISLPISLLEKIPFVDGMTYEDTEKLIPTNYREMFNNATIMYKQIHNHVIDTSMPCVFVCNY